MPAVPATAGIRALIQRQGNRDAGALPGGGADVHGAAGLMDGDGHETEAVAVVAPAGGGFTVKARAVVGHYQADAVVHGGELDGQVGRPGMFVDVTERLACRLVEEGRAVLRDLDAPVGGVPADGGGVP
jgi:hypothetical protein